MKTKPSHLPSISTLVNNSLNIFAQKLRPLVIWTIISIGFYAVALIVFVLIALVAGMQVLPLFRSGHMISQALTSAGIAIGILAVALFVVFGIASAISEAGFILIISAPFKNGYKDLFRKSSKLIIPLFVVGILSLIIVAGSFFVLFLPAIIFSFLLSFTVYEVVLHDVRGFQALRNSVRIILDNFWGVLGRVVLLWVVSFLAYYGVIAFAKTQHYFGFFTVAYYLFRILFGWFTTVYSIILYKEARSAANLKRPAPMFVIWIVTLLGWLILAALIFAAGRFVVGGGLKQLQNMFRQSSPYAHDVNTTQKQLYESQSLLTQIQDISKSEQEPERTQKIKSLNNQNINGLKHALLKDPNNQQLWQVLCVSYQLPNTVGTTDEKDLACSKTSLPTTTPTQ